MIEIVTGMAILGIVIYLIVNKKLEIEREIAYNKYILDRKKLRGSLKSKKKEAEDFEEDVQDFVDGLPPWLTSIAQGANIDLEAVYEGDPEELTKIKAILDKNLPGNTQNDNRELIG